MANKIVLEDQTLEIETSMKSISSESLQHQRGQDHNGVNTVHSPPISLSYPSFSFFYYYPPHYPHLHAGSSAGFPAKSEVSRVLLNGRECDTPPNSTGNAPGATTLCANDVSMMNSHDNNTSTSARKTSGNADMIFDPFQQNISAPSPFHNLNEDDHQERPLPTMSSPHVMMLPTKKGCCDPPHPTSSFHRHGNHQNVASKLIPATNTTVAYSISYHKNESNYDDDQQINSKMPPDFSADPPKEIIATPSSSSMNFKNVEEENRFRDYQEGNWNAMFKQLCDFQRTNGHCLVPNDYQQCPSLSHWVKRQRRQCKLRNEGEPNTMTEDRLVRLVEIGFIWDSHQMAWEQRFLELRAFQGEHGHCNVPRNYEHNPGLAIWVKRQRRQARLFWSGEQSSMNTGRIAKLENIGFVWEIRKSRNTTNTTNNKKEQSEAL